MRLKIFYIFLLVLLYGNSLWAQESYSKRYLRQLSENKPITHYDSMMVKGALLSATDTAKAMAFFMDAFETSNKDGNLKNQVLANIAAGEMLLEKNTLRKAFGYFFRSRNAIGDITADYEGALVSFGIARTQYLSGNYRPSTLNFLATIYSAQKIKNKELESEASEYLGLIYSNFQNYEESVSYYRKSHDLKKSLNDDKSCLRIAEKLGDIYYNNRRYDSAYYYNHLSLQLAETMHLPSDIGLARLNKSATLIRLKKLNDAQDELRYFNSIKWDKDNAPLKTRYLTIQGNYWLQKGNRKNAAVQYDSAIAVAQKFELPDLYSIVYRNMAESYYDLQDFKTAFEYYQKYTNQIRQMNSGGPTLNLESVKEYFNLKSSKDEIKLLNNENKLSALELLHESTLRKNLETENLLKDSIILRGKELSESLNREYALQQLKLKEERNFRISLAISLCSALLLGGLAYFLYRKQKKKNAIIAKQADDLETLMKEIHHRVKNNLQVISSLLDLQAMTIKDEKAAGAVKESKNRVQSMALIHQNLYNEGNIKGIKMEDYIQNLAKSLFDSYNIKPETIKLKTEIDPLSLDVDTVIPIGLALNELITNSLKYAFKDKNEGEITVILKKEDNDLLLKIKDNGIGFKTDYDNQGTTFGFKMIRAFAQKLKAQLDVFNDNGACVEMRIKKYKLA